MKKLLLVLHSFIIITILGCQENENNNSVYQNQRVIIDSISEIHDNGELKSEINYSENGIEIMMESDTVSYYICYNEDNDSRLNLSIGFNNKARALSVKYKGMNSSMDLIFIKQENENPGGAYPVLVGYYKEMYKEKVNGEYKLTHSGNWDYVEYIRGKDSKKFNFTIDRNSNSYSYTACF